MDDGSQWKQINDKLDDIATRLTKLETLRETEAERCKYVPDIIQARNTALAVDRLDARVVANYAAIVQMRISWARLVGLLIGSGILGGTLGSYLSGLLP